MELIGEIHYQYEDESVHSDLCGDPTDPEYRELLHKCLDEWLDRGRGSGAFYVSNRFLDYEAAL